MNTLLFALQGVAAACSLGAVAVPASGWLYPLQGMANFVPGGRNISILGSLANRGVVLLHCILDCFLAVIASVSA